MNKADRYLIFSITILIIFTVVQVVMMCLGKDLNDTLITCMFAFFGTEIAACCVIKVINIQHGDDDVKRDSD